MNQKKNLPIVGRSEEILQRNTSAINLLDKIEQDQAKRRFKASIRWWWNKITFRGHLNILEAQRQTEQILRRQIENKVRQVEASSG